jgi:hypothetical protein
VIEAEPGWYRAPAATRSDYEADRRGHAANYDLDPPLLAAVIYQESKFDAQAAQLRRAIGLMQLLPDPPQGIADPHRRQRFVVDDLSNPSSTPLRRRGTCATCSTVRRRGVGARRLQTRGRRNVDAVGGRAAGDPVRYETATT